MDKQGREGFRKRLLTGAAGFAAGVGLLLAGLFGTADELVEGAPEAETEGAGLEQVQVQTRAPSELTQLPIEEPLSLRDRARAWIWNLPATVRACVLLPCYGVGRLLMAVITPLFAALSPIAAAVAGFLARALLLLGLFVLLYKLIFPKGKLSTLFRKGRWLWLLCGAAVLTAADKLLLRYVPDYTWIRVCIGAVLFLAVILLLWNRLFRGHAAPEPPKKWIEIADAA